MPGMKSYYKTERGGTMARYLHLLIESPDIEIIPSKMYISNHPSLSVAQKIPLKMNIGCIESGQHSEHSQSKVLIQN
jgi:hypothetical protein